MMRLTRAGLQSSTGLRTGTWTLQVQHCSGTFAIIPLEASTAREPADYLLAMRRIKKKTTLIT